MTSENPKVERCTDPELVYTFPLYLGGHLDPEMKTKIEEHVRQCVVCQKDMRLFSDLQSIGKEVFGVGEGR